MDASEEQVPALPDEVKLVMPNMEVKPQEIKLEKVEITQENVDDVGQQLAISDVKTNLEEMTPEVDEAKVYTELKPSIAFEGFLHVQDEKSFAEDEVEVLADGAESSSQIFLEHTSDIMDFIPFSEGLGNSSINVGEAEKLSMQVGYAAGLDVLPMEGKSLKKPKIIAKVGGQEIEGDLEELEEAEEIIIEEEDLMEDRIRDFLRCRRKSAKIQYACSVCNKVFPQRNRLIYHQRVHTGERPFVCTICQKSYTYPNALKLHMKLHSDDYPHQCSYCDKKYKLKYQLTCHVRIHTNERPYVCKICSKGFTRSLTLKQHEESHRKEKPFKCRFCDMAFARWHQRASHEHTHTGAKPYVCDICGHGFTGLTTLVRHKRIHTGEKPCPCWCGKSFTDCSTLKRHQRTHEHAKPYECRICSKRYADARACKMHYQREHTEEGQQLKEERKRLRMIVDESGQESKRRKRQAKKKKELDESTELSELEQSPPKMKIIRKSQKDESILEMPRKKRKVEVEDKEEGDTEMEDTEMEDTEMEDTEVEDTELGENTELEGDTEKEDMEMEDTELGESTEMEGDTEIDGDMKKERDTEVEDEEIDQQQEDDVPSVSAVVGSAMRAFFKEQPNESVKTLLKEESASNKEEDEEKPDCDPTAEETDMKQEVRPTRSRSARQLQKTKQVEIGNITKMEDSDEAKDTMVTKKVVLIMQDKELPEESPRKQPTRRIRTKGQLVQLRKQQRKALQSNLEQDDS